MCRAAACFCPRKTCRSRDIALRWATDPAIVHKSYALAKKEFRSALLEVVAFHHPGSAAELAEEAASLLKALS